MNTPSPDLSPSPGFYVSAPGVNIGQLLGILLPLVVCAIAVLTYRDVRINRQQKASATEIRKAVESLAEVLSERLETKDNANVIRVDVGKLKTRIDTIQDVVRAIDAKVDALQRRRGGTP